MKHETLVQKSKRTFESKPIEVGCHQPQQKDKQRLAGSFITNSIEKL